MGETISQFRLLLKDCLQNIHSQKAIEILLILLVIHCQIFSNQILAQTTGTNTTNATHAKIENLKSYERDFFQQFNPQTAFDIIERLPGFTLDAGNDDLRGFGGAAGNVLIDGERPSSKSGGIEDALRRIPASRVERVEIIRGSAGASETAGQSVIANVIRRDSEAAGSWELNFERAADGTLNSGGEVTFARKFGQWDSSTKLNAFWERYPLEGPRVMRDASGMALSSQYEDRPSVWTQGNISTDAKRAFGGGIVNINARARKSVFLPDTERLGFEGRLPDGNPDERFYIDFDSTLTEAELGVDWNRQFKDDWSLKLLVFTSVSKLDDEQVVTEEKPVGNDVSGSIFKQIEKASETIFRATYVSASNGVLRPEFGGELAVNRLDSALSLVSGIGDEISTINLPAANVVVEELRAEFFANLMWKAADKLTVESGLAVEASKISVSGDASNRQSFAFAKPFVTLVYNVQPNFQIRLGGRHTVGQLDFSEFAASASAEDDRLLGGNPELGPDQTTRGSLTFDIRSETRGALNLELFHEWRQDVIEQILLPSGVFGSANAGNGRVWGATTNITVPLTALISGGLLEIEADIRDSEFSDPITGRDRMLSDVLSPSILLEFRQDLTEMKMAWGISYLAASDNQFFYGNEESFSTDGKQWSAFVETSRFKGIRVNLSLRNIGDRTFFRERRFFDSNRAETFTGSQTIERDRGMFVKLTFTGQF